jgi:TIR domain
MPEESDFTQTPANEVVPVVFISYAHESREHKAWVASFAQQLRAKRVEVLFDQWDIGFGDDVPKYMEQAVARADRVLMICTEAYVRKANDGKGGVGYETMVVTGELVLDLGTNKFIPIIRQNGDPKVLPKCVSTRLYVDLSEFADFEHNFEQLLRELHDVPKLSKPPLGANPFVAAQFEGAKLRSAKLERRKEFAELLASPDAAYLRAADIIHDGDRVAWRKLLLAASERAAASLKEWAEDNVEIPSVKHDDWSDRYAHAKMGVECYGPFIACLIAAAESDKAGFADQLGWVESILNPGGYNTTRTIYHMYFPQLVFFVTQALVGGMLMLSGTGEAAYALATTKLSDKYISANAGPLFEMARFNGWPESLNHESSVAWTFLDSLITSWTWLTTAFGNEQECRAGVSAYYQLLSFLNFVDLAHEGQFDEDGQKSRGFPVSVPLGFCIWPAGVVEKGYHHFLRLSPVLKTILNANSIDDSVFRAAWPKWISKVGEWLISVYGRDSHEIKVPQSKLQDHFKRLPFALR